jgi:hypothetical protein
MQPNRERPTSEFLRNSTSNGSVCHCGTHGAADGTLPAAFCMQMTCYPCAEPTPTSQCLHTISCATPLGAPRQPFPCRKTEQFWTSTCGLLASVRRTTAARVRPSAPPPYEWPPPGNRTCRIGDTAHPGRSIGKFFQRNAQRADSLGSHCVPTCDADMLQRMSLDPVSWIEARGLNLCWIERVDSVSLRHRIFAFRLNFLCT